MRYLARKFSLFGADEAEAAQIDEAGCKILDLRDAVVRLAYVEWTDEKAKELFMNAQNRFGWHGFAKMLESALEGRKYLVGNKVSYCLFIVIHNKGTVQVLRNYFFLIFGDLYLPLNHFYVPICYLT